MNIVLDDAIEELSNNKKEPIGMIVSCEYLQYLFDVEYCSFLLSTYSTGL